MTLQPTQAPPDELDVASPQLPEDHVAILLARAAHVVASGFQPQLQRRGVSLATWRLLNCLHHLPEGIAVTLLAAHCLLLQPTATKLVDRLTREGLVRRGTDPRDRRVVRVALTAAGIALADTLHLASRRYEASVFAHVPEAELAVLQGLLRRLVDRGDPAGQRRS